MNAPLKMKDLEARTEVSREAIHFYLREGLLPEPERPKRNVAIYSEEHVARIRLIKQLQEERHLPLGEIKKILDRVEIPLASAEGLAAFELMLLPLLNGDVPEPDQTLQRVASRSGLSQPEIRALHEAGVVRIRKRGGSCLLDFRDVAIVERWGRLLDLGFRDLPGYDESYLALFARLAADLAEQEVDLFLDAFQGNVTTEAAGLAARGIELSNEILVRMRVQALLRRLSSVTASD